MNRQDLQAILTPFSLVLLCAVLPGQGTAVRVRDHGAIPNDGINDLVGIRAAAGALQAGDVLEFESGTYDLIPSQTPSLGSPNPPGVPPKHMITLQNLAGILVEGNGATLLLHEFDPSQPINGSYYDLFRIEGCSDFEIRDLTVNMSRPAFSTGDCTAIYVPPLLPVSNRYFEMAHDTQYPGDPPSMSWKIHLITHSNPLYLPSGTHYRPNGRVFKYQQLTPIDPAGSEFFFSSTNPDRVKGRTSTPNLHGHKMMSELETASVDPGKLKVGDMVVLVHQWDYYVCFQLYGCSNPILSNLTIHAFAGMGVNLNFCSNPTVDGLTILPNPPERLVSLTADGLHVVQCPGTLLVTNCHIEANTENAVDIYNGFQRVECVADNSKLVYVDPGVINRVGDLYEFYDSKLVMGTSQQALNLRANETFCPQAGQTHELTFGSPTGLSAGDYICNLTLYPTQVDISACTVVGCWGDGFVVRRNVELTGCTVLESTGNAVSVFSERGWFNQGPGPMNVTVTNLVSNETSRGFSFHLFKAGAVTVTSLLIDPVTQAWSRAPLGAGTDVFVLNSILQNSGGCAVSVSSCDQVVIDLCEFDNINLHAGWLPPGFDFEAKSLIFLTTSDNVLISNNTRTGSWLGNRVRTLPPMYGYTEVNNSGW